MYLGVKYGYIVVLGTRLRWLFSVTPGQLHSRGKDPSAKVNPTTDNDPAIASHKLQTYLQEIRSRLVKCRMKANGTKSTLITFNTRRETCPPVHINNVQLPQTEEVKYLGLHLDRRLTWHKHIFTKRKHLGITLAKLYCLLGRKSKLSINNKLLIYETTLKTIWTYGIQLWATTSTSNINYSNASSRRLCAL
jgi:hypothetical protein